MNDISDPDLDTLARNGLSVEIKAAAQRLQLLRLKKQIRKIKGK